MSDAYKVATTVPELNVTSSVLTAISRHLGEACSNSNKAYTECKSANGGDPKKCMVEGAAVTQCTREFLKALKSSCNDQFEKQYKCLEMNNQEFPKCRETQNEFDNCVFDKLGIHGAFPTFD